MADEGEVFTDRLEHYTHLGDEWLGCSCLGEDTYLTCLKVVKMLEARKRLGQSVPLSVGCPLLPLA